MSGETSAPASDQGAFDAVISDVDGVVRLWPPDSMTRWDTAFGLPEGTLAGHAFAEHRLLPAITGQVTDEEWRAQVASDLQPVCGSVERARQLVAAWRARNGEANAEVVSLLTKARRHVRVVALSNATTLLEEQLAELGAHNAFDAIVNTAREGVCKPDPRIYRIAAERAGADPARCLYVDDSERNVETARELGMRAVHYREYRDLETALSVVFDPFM
ncbi:HAD family hydrolase [Flindersiella endophytica]